MGQNQGYGAFLIALGILAFFLVSRLRAHTGEDPLWLLRGELRQHWASAAGVINAVLLVVGTAIGIGSVSLGLFLMRGV